MPTFDPNLFAALLDQVEASVTASGGLHNTAEWLVKNTAHPSLPGRSWSFSEHAYQMAILNDATPQQAVRKSTQIGASEAILRLALALLAKLPNTKIIYVLPSQKFAAKFASSRIDPVIEASDRLKAITDRNINSTELKKIGSSFLFLAGAASETQAISIPAKVLIVDELAFCNPQVLSVFSSRLGHQKEHERIIRQFSSPLHPKSDISALFEAGTQKIYMVWHEKCGKWSEADVVEQLILPGYDGHLTDLSYSELRGLEGNIPQAFIRCEHCHEEITQANLCNPDYRAWVPRYPERTISSFDAGPLCVPEIRTPQAILKDLFLYRNTARWVQYSLGRPAESASEMILESSLERCFTVSQDMASSQSYGVIGVDIGKVSHYAVGKRTDGVFNITQLGTVTQDEEGATQNKIIQLQRERRAQQIVIDMMPDVSIVKAVQGQVPVGMCWGVYSVTGRGKGNLELLEKKEKEGVISVARTRAMDAFVTEFNEGKIRLPKGLADEKEVRAHLTAMKRVISLDSAGEDKAQWVASNPSTHYFFCIWHAWLADHMIQESMNSSFPSGVSTLMSKVRLRAA
jgi:hypothetical protein